MKKLHMIIISLLVLLSGCSEDTDSSGTQEKSTTQTKAANIERLFNASLLLNYTANGIALSNSVQLNSSLHDGILYGSVIEAGAEVPFSCNIAPTNRQNYDYFCTFIDNDEGFITFAFDVDSQVLRGDYAYVSKEENSEESTAVIAKVFTNPESSLTNSTITLDANLIQNNKQDVPTATTNEKKTLKLKKMLI